MVVVVVTVVAVVVVAAVVALVLVAATVSTGLLDEAAGVAGQVRRRALVHRVHVDVVARLRGAPPARARKRPRMRRRGGFGRAARSGLPCAYTRGCDRLAETEGRARRGRTAARANFGSCTAQGRRAGLGLVVVAENVVALRAAAEGGQVQAVLALVELGLGGLQVGAGRPEAPREAVVVGGVGD